MNVAIFYDAAPVAGDDRAARPGQGAICSTCWRDNSAFHARFARAIELFDTPLGLLLDLRHRGRRAQGRARPQEGRHLSADARGAGAGAGAAAGRDQHGPAHPPPAGPGRVRQGAGASSWPTRSTSCSACACRTRLEKMRLHQPLDNFVRAGRRSASSSATCSRTRCRSSSGSRKWSATTSTWRCSEPADAADASSAPGGGAGSKDPAYAYLGGAL